MILILCLTCLAGCKEKEEDFGVRDSLVDIQQNHQENPPAPKPVPDQEQPSAAPDENPKVPSFFEEGKIKSCTWAKLRENKSGEELYFYSIHISNNGHEGGSTGIESMILLNKTVSQLPADCYAFLGGDYNIRYQDWIYQRCVDFEVMVDLKDEALHLADEGLAEIGGNTGSVCPDYEREATGGNYGTPKIIAAPKSQAIDHLMAKTNPRIAVDYWGYDYTTTKVPGENVVEGYVSDHYALVVKLRIATNGDYAGYQRPYGE